MLKDDIEALALLLDRLIKSAKKILRAANSLKGGENRRQQAELTIALPK